MLDRVVLEVSGTLLVLFTVREIFHDIFHPTRSGSLSDFVGRIASLFMRHTRLRSSVGPLALVAVMLCWVVLLAIGFALLYTGLYPQEFISSAGEVSHGFWMKFLRSLYFSLGSLGAFQTFDLNPRTAWLRLIVAIEGLVGISMITASVSWLVLLYPALARTRMLARRLFVLIEAEKMTSLSLVRELGVPVLSEIAQGVVQLRLDLILFPILLNFYPADESATIAHALPQAVRLAREGRSSDCSSNVRLAAAQLQVALEELSRFLAIRIVQIEEPEMEKVLDAFAKREW